MSDLAAKNIVLGVTGGIAAYKAAELCRLMVKAGATVRVVMTDAATRFITPLTMQTLSGAPVALHLVDADEEARIGHIRLGDEADAIVVAPATANSLAAFAAGSAGDLLSAVVLASTCPVLLAPAMNVNMWRNPLTQRNLERLLSVSRFSTVGPDAGELACGWIGEGRLMEPAAIVAALERLLATMRHAEDLRGRRIVVTAGPTFEPIDDVRFLGNRSSGKMGFALAEVAARRGADVTLIAGPVALPTPNGVRLVRQDVETADQMAASLTAAAADADVVVMAAAVADFRPARRTPGKLSRRGTPAPGSAASAGADGAAELSASSSSLNLPLVANADLLAEMGTARRGARPLLVGFAAEFEASAAQLVQRAREKLAEKGCDVIVANDVGAAGIGFGSDENAVTMVFADGACELLPRAAKTEIAAAIWDRLMERLPGVGDRLHAGGGSPPAAESMGARGVSERIGGAGSGKVDSAASGANARSRVRGGRG